LIDDRWLIHPIVLSKSAIVPHPTIPCGNSSSPSLKAGYIDSLKQGRRADMRIAIASDHAAVELKAALAAYLGEIGHDVTDLGPHDGASVDYPDFGYLLADHIASGKADRGVALCGTGIGISIAINRNADCRCARVDEPLSAKLSRDHNDANIIAMGARMIGVEMAKACIDAFLSTPFGGDRHSRRVNKLSHPQLSKEPA
jgi:ribose 5-phosphate isomerase B